MTAKWVPIAAALTILAGCCAVGPWYADKSTLVVKTTDSSGWQKVVVGYDHACGIRSSGDVQCWGSDLPTFDGARGVLDIGLGARFACVVSSIGYPNCTGVDWDGSISPPAVELSKIDTGMTGACGIGAETGELHCWGQLSGTTYGSVWTSALGSFKDVGMDIDTACGLEEDGSAVCWVCREDSTLQSTCDVPEATFEQIAVGELSVCGVRDDGYIQCWGPIAGTTSERYDYVSTTVGLTCGITLSGTVRCWERDPSITWLPLDNDEKFVQIDVSDRGFCGVLEDSRILCWGDGGNPAYADLE